MRATLVLPLCLGAGNLPASAAPETPAGQACSFLLELHAKLTRAQM